ncbi:ArsA family ATPase [Nocardioides marmoribigeumensis]|uniref:Anion-transporting ArsA/GET3 family ATPase n=1 Tax=Nocardioides marmoribigeumensis TaxID=433649 RepID=A0ABU2BU60_9ACTN|nr:ArsA-related P-loop ATPase [Nocardioides marmoribigeumensis]MDR7362163.1 anion-transporting ArsA/GET3 family ATPase [Nocardioides marmoribigeumensis]
MSDPSAKSRTSDWPHVELHVVSGKGGTGKTTVAAALALALASRGKQVLLCEVEGRQGIAQLFDVPPLPYEERRIAQGLDDGGDVYALAIDAESAMLEYIQLYYRMGNRTAKVLDRFGVLDFATTIAPGLRDVLLTGKVFEAVERNSRNKGARVYDAVVLDAPPTGRIAQFLNVNGEFGDLAKVGMVRGQTERVMSLLKSRRTAVHLVTVLEDMPVQETADGVKELRGHGLPVGGVVVNLTRPAELDDESREAALAGRLSAEATGADLSKAGVDVTDELVEGLLEEATAYAERRGLEDRQRERIAEIDVPSYELQRLPDGIDLGGLYELAEDLREQGMA